MLGDLLQSCIQTGLLRTSAAVRQPVLSWEGGSWLTGAEHGRHLCLRFPHPTDDRTRAREAAKLNLTVRPLSAYGLARTDVRGLVVGYGYAPLGAIQRRGPLLADMQAGL